MLFLFVLCNFILTEILGKPQSNREIFEDDIQPKDMSFRIFEVPKGAIFGSYNFDPIRNIFNFPDSNKNKKMKYMERQSIHPYTTTTCYWTSTVTTTTAEPTTPENGSKKEAVRGGRVPKHPKVNVIPHKDVTRNRLMAVDDFFQTSTSRAENPLIVETEEPPRKVETKKPFDPWADKITKETKQPHPEQKIKEKRLAFVDDDEMMMNVENPLIRSHDKAR